jgi:hypothetical protein
MPVLLACNVWEANCSECNENGRAGGRTRAKGGLDVRTRLGGVRLAQDRPAEALQLFDQVLTDATAQFGQEHEEVADIEMERWLQSHPL